MLRSLSARTALAIGAALILAGPAAAQYYPAGGWYRSGPPVGFSVRAFGFYAGIGLPPGPGGYEAYYPGRPIVTVADPWGRVADVPLRPKVLYYSDQFLTPHGSFYPTSIVVIPDDRRPRTVVMAPSTSTSTRVVPAAPPASTPAPVVRQGAPPPKAQPPSEGLPPPPPSPAKTTPPPPLPRLPDQPPKAMPPEPPIPKATDLDRTAEPAKPAAPERPRRSDVPAVPELPRLPDVPAIPDGTRPAAKPAADKVPSLGPSPMDASLPPRPAK